MKVYMCDACGQDTDESKLKRLHTYGPYPHYIELSTLDQSVSPAAPIQLNLWRRNTVPKSGEAVVIPGNSYGSPGWKSVTKGTPAMYLVLVQPKTQTSTACTCSTSRE